jgi:hypothetical protein
LIRRLTELASVRPRILLIIGYPERDAEVVKRFIHPLASRWRVIRVSLSSTGEGAITLPAGTALEELAGRIQNARLGLNTALGSQVSGWRKMGATIDTQHAVLLRSSH